MIPHGPKRRPKRSSAKRDARELKEAEQTGKVLELRKQGNTLKRIGEEVGLSGPTVSKIIKATIAQVYQGKAQEYMGLTMRRLEALLGVLWERAQIGDIEGSGPDLEAVEQARKLIADMRTLTGIDAPKRQELTGAGGGPVEVAAVQTRLDARLAAMSARLAAGADIVVRQVTTEDEDDGAEGEDADTGAGAEVQGEEPEADPGAGAERVRTPRTPHPR